MSVLLGAVLFALGLVLIVYRTPIARRGVQWYVKFAGRIPSDPGSSEVETRESALRKACMLFGAVFIVMGLSYLVGA